MPRSSAIDRSNRICPVSDRLQQGLSREFDFFRSTLTSSLFRAHYHYCYCTSEEQVCKNQRSLVITTGKLRYFQLKSSVCGILHLRSQSSLDCVPTPDKAIYFYLIYIIQRKCLQEIAVFRWLPVINSADRGINHELISPVVCLPYLLALGRSAIPRRRHTTVRCGRRAAAAVAGHVRRVAGIR